MSATTDGTQPKTPVLLYRVWKITYYWPTTGISVGYTDSIAVYFTARRIPYCVITVPEIVPDVDAKKLEILKRQDGKSEPVKNRDPYLILGSDDWRLKTEDLLGKEEYDAESKKHEDDEDSNSESDGEEPWATGGLLDFLEKFHSEASKKPAEYVPIPGRLSIVTVLLIILKLRVTITSFISVTMVTQSSCTKIETAHTNDLELIGMIAFIKEWLRRGKQWDFKSIDVKSHEELVEIQRKNGGAIRTYAKAEDEVDDEDIDRGYEGWVTPGLYKAIERAYDSAYRKEARIQHEESQNVRRVRYYAMIDGHRQPVIGRTNSDRVFANINIINDDIKKRDPRTKCLWEILDCPFKDYEELIEEQRCNGGCIRARKKGKDYGDKNDDIHKVDKKWYDEQNPQYSGSESEDDEEEDHLEECYEGTWSTRDLLIAQDKAAKKADWFPSHLRLGNVSKKTPASTEKGDFKRKSSNREEEGKQHVLRWMERQG
ncbi:hypothetical protein J4E81_001876 [Alternaria sp. BMP 2799]|nr:hypothetical protein J4E81_001876 [Alternaria sp. BMP 2799]